jgi:hypothetical protein
MTVIEVLEKYQKQLDPEGIEVGVSRQALDELIALYKDADTALAKKDKELVELKESHQRILKVLDNNKAVMIGNYEKELTRLRDENAQLLSLSMNLDEHPDDYDGPCLCKSCQSYIEAVDAE